MEAKVGKRGGVAGRRRRAGDARQGAGAVIESQKDCRGLTRHVKRAFVTQTNAAGKGSLAPISPTKRKQILVKVPHT